MKVLSVVGARPEFVQSAPVSRALRAHHQEVLVHTGQHYDYRMSQAFFDELGIATPDYNLGVGSGSHGRQTAEILAGLEEVLQTEQPDLVIVRGDTNSTVAGSLAASKLAIPTAHIEAGERSYDRRMPEEINRLVADHLADLHLCASQAAVQRLADEGIVDTVHWVGDVMYDALLQNLPLARERSSIMDSLGLVPQHYALVTVHRAGNTDDPPRLRQIVDALNSVAETVVFPAHPRTQQALASLGAGLSGRILQIDPVSYFDMLELEENARLIATDSGGVQREAYCLGVPCLTLREKTEWVETVQTGWNLLVGVDPHQIAEAWRGFHPHGERPPIFGDGHAAERIVRILDDPGVRFGAAHQWNRFAGSHALQIGATV